MKQLANSFLVLIFFLLLFNPVLALSISPAQQVFNTAGAHPFSITVRPEETGTLMMHTTGDLASAITFDNYTKDIDNETTITGIIIIPSDLSPGDHEQRIIATITKPESNVMSAGVEVISLLLIRKEYDGPYLVASVSASTDSGKPDTATVYLTLENRGNTAITPNITLVHANRVESLTSASIPGKGVGSFSKEIHGHGDEEITLRVTGANTIEQKFTVTLGIPTIKRFSAVAVPEQGTIIPINIIAQIDWNTPVQAQVIVAGKTTTVTINRTLQQTVYAETTEKYTPATLKVGSQETTILVDLAPQAVVPAKDHSTLWLILILLALIIIPIIMALKYRGSHN